MTKLSSYKILLRLLCLTALALGLTGCTGYKLGSMLPDDLRTIYIPNFTNQTGEPYIITGATKAVIEEIQQDGSLEIVSDPNGASMVMQVTLKDYDLTPLAFDRSNRARTNQYRVKLTAEMKVIRTRDQKVLVYDPRVSGDATFPFTSDFTTTKRQALPRAAEDLAHDIVERVVEAWY
jgi:hypothetical protein